VALSLHCKAASRRGLEFETIAEGVFGVEAGYAGESAVVDDGDSSDLQRAAKILEIDYVECRVGFFRRAKIMLDANVQLLRAALEPAASSGAQFGRLGDFCQAQNVAIKFSRDGFAVLRRGDLYVVDGGEAEGH